MPTAVGASRLLPSGTQLCKLIILLIVILLGSASVVQFLGVLDLLWQYCGIILAVLAIASILWLFWITPVVVKQPFPQEMEEVEMTGAAPNLQEEPVFESSDKSPEAMRARKQRLPATTLFSANSQRNVCMAKPRRPEAGEPFSEVDSGVKREQELRDAEKERELAEALRQLSEEQQARAEEEAQAKEEGGAKKEAEAKEKARADEEALAQQKAEEEAARAEKARKEKAAEAEKARAEEEARAKQEAVAKAAQAEEKALVKKRALQKAQKKAAQAEKARREEEARAEKARADEERAKQKAKEEREAWQKAKAQQKSRKEHSSRRQAARKTLNVQTKQKIRERKMGQKGAIPSTDPDSPSMISGPIMATPGDGAARSYCAESQSANDSRVILKPRGISEYEDDSDSDCDGPELGDDLATDVEYTVAANAAEISQVAQLTASLSSLRIGTATHSVPGSSNTAHPPIATTSRASVQSSLPLCNAQGAQQEPPSSKLFRQFVARKAFESSTPTKTPGGGFASLSEAKSNVNKPGNALSKKASPPTNNGFITMLNKISSSTPVTKDSAHPTAQTKPSASKPTGLFPGLPPMTDYLSQSSKNAVKQSQTGDGSSSAAPLSKTAAPPPSVDPAKSTPSPTGRFGSGSTGSSKGVFAFSATSAQSTANQETSTLLGSDDSKVSQSNRKRRTSDVPSSEATSQPGVQQQECNTGQTTGGPASTATAQGGPRNPRLKALNIFEIHAKSPKSLSAAIKDFFDGLEDPFDELDAERAGLRFVKSKKLLDKYQSITKFINKLCIFAAPKGHWDEQRLSRTAAKYGGIMTARIFHKVHMKLETLSSPTDLSGNHNEPSVQAAWAAMKRLEEIWTHAGGFASQATAASQAQMANMQDKAKVGADRHSAVESAQEMTNAKSVAPRKDSIMEIDVVTKQHEPPNAPKMSSKSQGKQPAKDSEPDSDTALSEDEVTKQLYGDDCMEDAPQKSSNGTPAPPSQASTASAVSTANQASKKQLQNLALPGLTLPKQLFPKASTQVATDSAMMDVLDTGNNGKTAASAPAAPRQSRSAPASDTTDAQMTDIPGANTAQTSAAVLAPQASTAQQLQSASAPASVSLDAQMANSPLNGAGATQSPGPAPTVQPAPTQLPLPPFVPPKRNRFLKCKDKKSVVELLKKELSTSIWMQSFSNLSNKDPPATWTTQAFLDNCKLIKELFEEIKDYVVRDGYWIIDIISYKEGNETGIDSPKYKRVYNEFVVLNQDHGNNNSAIREAYEAMAAVRGAWQKKKSLK